MATTQVSLRSIARSYGYDESTVRDWRDREDGMPTDTLSNAQAWIVQNVLAPLRDTTLQEQIQQQKLRKLTAEADKAVLENEITSGNAIASDELEKVLSSYFQQIKNHFRSLPQKHHLRLLESATDALSLRDELKIIIDQTLTEIGDVEIKDDHERVPKNKTSIAKGST